MEGIVTLNKKEQKRLMVISKVERGEVGGCKAAALAGISLRHFRRLVAGYRGDGVRALDHGNRGRTPANALGSDLRKQVIELALKFNLRQYTAVPYWEPTPLFADPEYDLYLIYYQHSLTTYTSLALNPIIMEIAENDPYLLAVMINEQTAGRRGIKDGDEVWIESRIAKTKGRAKLSQGIHPEVVAISGGFGRWLNHPVAKGKGVDYNAHLPMDFDHSGMIGGSMESAARVRISKVQKEETK